MTIGGKDVGSAYGCEFPIVEEDCRDLQQVEVLLVGHLFRGGEVHAMKMVEVLRIDQQPTMAAGKDCSMVSEASWEKREGSSQESGASPV